MSHDDKTQKFIVMTVEALNDWLSFWTLNDWLTYFYNLNQTQNRQFLATFSSYIVNYFVHFLLYYSQTKWTILH